MNDHLRELYVSGTALGSELVGFETNHKFEFPMAGGQTQGYTVDLILQRNGNLRTRPISGSRF